MRSIWRNKQKCLFTILLTLTALVIFYTKVLSNKSNEVVVKRISTRKTFIDLPETKNNHYKIWKNLYFSVYNEDLLKKEDIDVGIATQSSIHHLHNLIYLSKTWQGPISVGVFSLGSQWNLLTKTIKNLVLCHQSIARFVTFHALLPLSHPPDEDILGFAIDDTDRCDTTFQMGSEVKVKNYDDALVSYPVNALRNIAVNNLGTSHVFMIDVDMVPNMELREFLLKKLKINQLKPLNAYVIPAFEIFSSSSLPESKAALLKEWKMGRVRPFYSTVCWKCQKHTDYEKWQRGPDDYEKDIMFYGVTWKDPWEPFYVIDRKLVHYDERFEQYGFNRISQLCDIHLRGVDFVVLYDAFLLHFGFKDPKTFHKRKDEENNRNRILYRQIKREKQDAHLSNDRRC